MLKIRLGRVAWLCRICFEARIQTVWKTRLFFVKTAKYLTNQEIGRGCHPKGVA